MSATAEELPSNYHVVTTEDEAYDILMSSPISIVNFSAPLDPTCAHIDSVFLALAKKTHNLAEVNVKAEDLAFVYVDAEKIPQLTKAFNIEYAPSFLVVSPAQGKLVVQVRADEVTPQDLTNLVHEALNIGEQSQEALEDKLKKLINQSEVMLFMKGSPYMPRCGFSKRTVDMLEDSNIEFGSFDILNDNIVREGLKKFSNWPTYPQLYVKGELLGGYDIISELYQSGELVQNINDMKS